MEEEFIQNKIKNELVNKNFENWTKDSINFLASIFEYPKYNSFYDVNIMLLDDYIKWYKKTDNSKKINNNDTYPLNTLMLLYCLINRDVYHNEHYNYNNTLNNSKEIVYSLTDMLQNILNTNFFSFSSGLFLTILYIIIKYILSFFSFKKREEKRHIFELKIPLPENLINNPLVKMLLGNTFNSI